jgi:hypothetical protein
MKIKYVLETHRNEDYIIGSRELADDSELTFIMDRDWTGNTPNFERRPGVSNREIDSDGYTYPRTY